jgi:four helix bundle protein
VVDKKITRFEDIIAWQKAMTLCVKIYDLLKDHNDYSFRNQIQRAAISISNNIAEGYERMNNNELRYFLYVAKGSSGEVRSMLRLAVLLGIITEKMGKELVADAEEISKILSGLIKTL